MESGPSASAAARQAYIFLESRAPDVQEDAIASGERQDEEVTRD